MKRLFIMIIFCIATVSVQADGIWFSLYAPNVPAWAVQVIGGNHIVGYKSNEQEVSPNELTGDARSTLAKDLEASGLFGAIWAYVREDKSMIQVYTYLEGSRYIITYYITKY
jgi:hypothetical protein